MTPEEWAKHPQALAMTEAQLQTGVQHLLTAFGWRWYHTHDSRRSQAGFPDLCAVRARDGRLLFAELKAHRGRVRPEQRSWLDDLEAVVRGSWTDDDRDFPESVLWRPSDFLSGTIERVLR